MKEKITSITIPSGWYVALKAAIILGFLFTLTSSLETYFNITQQFHLSSILSSFSGTATFIQILVYFLISYLFYYKLGSKNNLVKGSSATIMIIAICEILYFVMARHQLDVLYETFPKLLAAAQFIAFIIQAIGLYQCIGDKKKYIGFFKLASSLTFYLVLLSNYAHFSTAFMVTFVMRIYLLVNILLIFTYFYFLHLLFKKEPYQEPDEEAVAALNAEEIRCHWILANWSNTGKKIFWISFATQLFTLFGFFTFSQSNFMLESHLSIVLVILMLLSSWIWGVVWGQIVEISSPLFTYFSKSVMQKVMFGIVLLWLFFYCYTTFIGRFDDLVLQDLQDLSCHPFTTCYIAFHLLGYALTRKTNITAKRSYIYIGGLLIMFFYLFVTSELIDSNDFSPYRDTTNIHSTFEGAESIQQMNEQ